MNAWGKDRTISLIAHLQINAQETSVLDSREKLDCDCKMRTAEIEL